LPERHELLRLDAAGWSELLHRRPDLAALPAVQAWSRSAYPVMCRRRLPDDPVEFWPAAIALPPSQGRLRLGLTLRPEHVAGVAPPPLLQEALEGNMVGKLPDAWRARSELALAAGGHFGFAPRLFGSAMWQCVTGLAYVRDSSDLDLLWPVLPRADAAMQLAGLLQALARIDREAAGPRLDGEIVFASVGAVNWKELVSAGQDDDILVKTRTDVRIMTRAQLAGLAACA